MAIAFNAAGAGANTSGATSISWSHTAAGGTDCVVLVGITTQTTQPPPTVTYGGTPMMPIGGLGSPTEYVYALFNPATGAQTVQVTMSASTLITGSSVSYTGVLALGGPTQAYLASGTAVTVTQPTVASVGRGVVSFHGCGNAATRTFGSLSGTSRVNVGGTTTRFGLLIQDSLAVGSASVTMTATMSGAAAVASNAVELVPTGDTQYEAVKLINGWTVGKTTGSSASLGASVSHNTPRTGDDVVAVVAVSVSVSSSSTDTTIAATYGGIAMTQLKFGQYGTSTARGAEALFMLANPATGSQTVSVTTGGAATKASVIVLCETLCWAGDVFNTYSGSGTSASPVVSTGVTIPVGYALASAFTSALAANLSRPLDNAATKTPTWRSEGGTVSGSGDSGLALSGVQQVASSDLSYQVNATNAAWGWVSAVFEPYVPPPAANNTGAFFVMF